MTANWPRVRALFERAIELPSVQRAAFLDAEVGADAVVRAEVERLLRAESGQGEFLQPPGPATIAADILVRPLSYERLGGFRIVRQLARGGMGTVYVAEQDHPARTVAIKVMHGSLGVPRARERFQAEVDVLARLQHAGIAQVLEAGVEADGTAWFAMELLAEATPITRHATQTALDAKGRLRLFLQVCAAVHHAHQRGVIHRDLKPANILVLPDGVAKVIDFGIARTLDADRTAQTLAGELLGTLAYMSPEQVEGRETDVRTDVYGLGVVLHELLTGNQPFALAELPLTAACRVICEQDPPTASLHCPGSPRELDWILLRALRKEPEARYASVAEFAADVQRFLDHEPIQAGPDSATYRLRKFVRRHRVGVSAALLVVGVTISAFVLVTSALWQTQRAESAEREGRTAAEASAQRASAALDFLLDVFSSVEPGKDGREVKMADALQRAAHDFGARFATQPAIRTALADTIGKAFVGLGLLAEGETHLQDSLAVQEQWHGPQSRGFVQALVALADVQVRRGELAAAQASLDRAEPVVQALGDESLRLAYGIRRADWLRAKGDKQPAVDLLRPIVARLRELHGRQHRDTWTAIGQLAGTLHELGQLKEAEPLYREALDAIAAQKGEDHPDVLTARGNYMMVLYSSGRRADMVPQLEQLLASRRRVLGENHPETIGTISNLGGVHFGLAHFKEAAHYFDDALARLGPDVDQKSALYLTLTANLATTERELGHFPRAIEFGERALAAYTHKLGANHDTTLKTKQMLADVHRQAGALDVSIAMYTACREAAAAASPVQVANVYRCELGLARCYAAKRDFERAEQLFLHLRETWAASDQANAVKGQLTRPEADLEVLYRDWGRPLEAAKYASPKR